MTYVQSEKSSNAWVGWLAFVLLLITIITVFLLWYFGVFTLNPQTVLTTPPCPAAAPPCPTWKPTRSSNNLSSGYNDSDGNNASNSALDERVFIFGTPTPTRRSRGGYSPDSPEGRAEAAGDAALPYCEGNWDDSGECADRYPNATAPDTSDKFTQKKLPIPYKRIESFKAPDSYLAPIQKEFYNPIEDIINIWGNDFQHDGTGRSASGFGSFSPTP